MKVETKYQTLVSSRWLYMDVVVSDSISQDILSQIYDVIQSDVALHLQVH